MHAILNDHSRLKCDLYFNSFNQLNGNDSLIDTKLRKYHYETGLDTMSTHLFFEKQYNKIKSQFKLENKDIKEINSNDISSNVNKQIEVNEVLASDYVNAIGTLRLHDHCNLVESPSLSHDQCMDLESKLFPWFTFENPVFERWDGTKLQKFPHIQLFQDSSIAIDQHDSVEKPCFWSNMQSKYNGKGLVIPINSDSDMNYATLLVKVLRLLKNQLPIQFVYNNYHYKLNQEILTKLIATSRDILNYENGENVKGYKQEIWFVDVGDLLTLEYRLLNKESLTLMATIFSSFEQAIVLNSDVVPVQNLEKLFDNLDFLQTGLFLFKTRLTGVELLENFSKLIQIISPSVLETTNFPEIPQLPRFPLNNYLNLKISTRLSDPRLFVIDKTRPHKLGGLLTSLHLKLTSDIHDEELLWLGQFLHNSDFSHNDIQPGAIGQLFLNYIEQPTILSKQVGQFIGRKDLYWISDGLYQCNEVIKRDEYEILSKDDEKPGNFKDATNEEELTKLYHSPIKITHAIIPPETGNKKQNGWVKTKYCNDKIFQAHQHVTLRDEDEPELEQDLETRVGKYFKFNSEQVQSFEKLINAWQGKYKTSKLEL